MNTLALQKSLIERMPKVEGTYTENYNLARHMWFKVGGPAEIAFEPKGLGLAALFLHLQVLVVEVFLLHLLHRTPLGT